MKPLNRKCALIVLGIVEAIVLISLFVLLEMGKMSNVTFILTLFTILSLSLAVLVFILYKYPVTTFVRQDGFDPDSVNVSRTREGTIFEAVTGLLVAAAWIIALATRSFIGEDGGILYRYIFNVILTTCWIVFFLVDVYTPSEIHGVGRITNARQVSLAVRMYRIQAVLFALALVTLNTPALPFKVQIGFGEMAIIIGVFIVFYILIRKAKDAE